MPSGATAFANATVVAPEPRPTLRTLAWLRPGAVDQNVRDRPEQDLLCRVAIGPFLAARSIPISDLVGVLFASAWLFDGAPLAARSEDPMRKRKDAVNQG